ncbi:unnamed protein product [Effrenium voratum]|uniref:Uncharacterized protein n=1 Tax=Effrenium voratum TaxID=2562239 RepID=A0AA36I3D4_9DINO|nr:unnamed protein product [Effrenium voratum]CAJ1456420.1 unnamed protein product [Effrenium voratum]
MRGIESMQSYSGMKPLDTDDIDTSSELSATERLLHVDLQLNTHSAGLLAVAQATDAGYIEEFGRAQALGRLANGLILFTLGSAFQAVLVALLILFSEERMQDPYEKAGTARMTQELQDAMNTNTPLHESDPTLAMCKQDHSVPFSQSLVIFIWICRLGPSITTALWTLLAIIQVSSNHSTNIGHDKEKAQIKSLPCTTKFLTLLFIQVPVVILHVVLLWAGMKFLMYCDALGKLVVKAMSVAYVETIPSIVFVGLSSAVFRAEVGKSQLSLRMRHTDDSWFGGMLKILISVALSLWYCRIYHASLQNFRLACFQYKYQFVFPVCDCGLDFFGFHLAN